MSFTNIRQKKYLAIAGVIWLIYLIFHAVSLLIFHQGALAFNGFFNALNGSFLYVLMLVVLAVSLGFHVRVAVQRQRNNSRLTQRYEKPYPHAVPRFIAWSGAGTLLFFIVFHALQMTFWLDHDNLYHEILSLMASPIMWAIYAAGLITLGAHLQHSLSNMRQSLGVSARQNLAWVWVMIGLLLMSFASILVQGIR